MIAVAYIRVMRIAILLLFYLATLSSFGHRISPEELNDFLARTDLTVKQKSDTVMFASRQFSGDENNQLKIKYLKTIKPTIQQFDNIEYKLSWMRAWCMAISENGEYEKAIKIARSLLKIAEQLEDPFWIAKVQISLYRLYNHAQLNEKAKEALIQSTKFANMTDNLWFKMENSYLLGYLFYQEGKSDSAISYLKKSIQFNHQMKGDKEEWYNIELPYLLGRTYLRIEDYKNGLSLLKEVEKNYTKSSGEYELYYLGGALMYQSLAYATIGTRDSAKVYFDKCVRVYKKQRPTFLHQAHYYYADIHTKIGDYQTAAKHFDFLNDSAGTVFNNYVAAIAYGENKEYEKAMKHFKTAFVQKDSTHNDYVERLNLLLKESAKADIEKQKEIEKARKISDEKEIASQARQKKIILWSALVIGVIILLFTRLLFSRYKVIKAQKEEIKEQKEGVEKEVEERTWEISEQKKQLEKTYHDAELLHEIGKEITSYLSVSKINKEVYEKVNKLMKADGFGIGIADKEAGKIYFPGYIEKGVIYEEETSYDINDMDRLACVCYHKQMEILIGNTEKELHLYTNNYAAPVIGEVVRSVIYVPIILKDKKIGVITVQSFEENAFTSYHMNMVKSIATHTAIALDNAQLYESLEEKVIERTKQVVEQKQEIVDSINYAKRIQDAILPSKETLSELLGNHFVFYKPKDIVAGDFYWLEKMGNNIYFAAADCTGHGVPGAMVSVVCSTALSKVLVEENINDVGKMLDRTRELIIDRFGRSGESIQDGMDLALCKLNVKTRELEYAGANNPLWIVRQGSNEIEETKPDKQPVGKYDAVKPFTSHHLQLHKNDKLYIFSDGFQDQFGGDRGKKYKSNSLKQFLLTIQDKDLTTQHRLLDKEFEDWKGDLEQIDDVCVIGVKV